MILHIHTSWTIFTGLSRDIFLSSNIPCTHLILQDENTEGSIYPDVRFLRYSSSGYSQFLHQQLDKYKLILFHGLFSPNLQCLKDILARQNHPPVAWVIYGAEIEDSFIFPGAFLDPRTRFAYFKLLPYRVFIPFHRILNRTKGLYLIRLIKHIDFYAHFMPEEVEFIEEQTGVRKPVLWHSYTMIEDFVGHSLIGQRCSDSGHMLIGNSASFSSNQLEILHILSCKGSGMKKVIVPLGYGNSTYRTWLVKKGRRLLGNNFIPVTGLLSKEEYNRLLSDCSVLIINSYKQQALGNIITAAWIGMRIYLRKKTSTYRYLKRIGITVFSIEDDFDPADTASFARISQDSLMQNRRILSDIFSCDNMRAKLRETFKPFSG